MSRQPMPGSPTDRPAGIITRLAAAAIDLVVVLLMLGCTLLGVAGVRFFLSPLSFRWPAPSWPQSLLVGALLAAAYLTAAWATTGRTYGGAVFGLRVLSARGDRLGWARAAVRAVLCLVFPPGLLTSAISRRRRSVQDVLLFTTVVYDRYDYDWNHDAPRLAAAPTPPTSGRQPHSIIATGSADRRLPDPGETRPP